MKRKILFLAALFSFILSSNISSALVEIIPAGRNLSIFSDIYYNFNVTISGVNNVYGFQFDIRYDSDAFNLSGVSAITEGNFLSGNGQFSTYCIAPGLSTPGLIDNYACTRTETASGANGTGNLARIRLTLRPLTAFPDINSINISDLKISNINSQPLNNSRKNGIATVYECLYRGGNPETRSCTLNGCTGTATCNFNNQWAACSVSGTAETCDGLDNDCDGIVDEYLSRPCSTNRHGICAVGQEVCSDGEWSGCPQPQEEVCENEIDENCDGSDSSCLGDIIDDGCVNILDLNLVGLNFGMTSGFDSRADTDKNGEVDIFDLVIVAKEFGAGCD